MLKYRIIGYLIKQNPFSIQRSTKLEPINRKYAKIR